MWQYPWRICEASPLQQLKRAFLKAIVPPTRGSVHISIMYKAGQEHFPMNTNSEEHVDSVAKNEFIIQQHFSCSHPELRIYSHIPNWENSRGRISGKSSREGTEGSTERNLRIVPYNKGDENNKWNTSLNVKMKHESGIEAKIIMEVLFRNW